MAEKSQVIRLFDIEHARELTPAQPQRNVPASPCQACSVRNLSLCAVLEERELHEMSDISTDVFLDPGDPLFDEGEPATKVFNLIEGSLKIFKLLPDGRRQVTGFLFPGDFLGIANQDSYAYSAEAVTRSKLCQFTRTKLGRVFERYPKLERRLLSIASHELASAQEQMLLLGRKNAREKVASFLLSLSHGMARSGATKNPVAVPMSRADIGDYLGLTTETVSRTFSQLKQQGTIRLLPGGMVELNDMDKLTYLAEGF